MLLYSSNSNIKNFFKVKSLSSAACLNCFLKDASILKFRSTVLPLSRLLLTLFSFRGGGGGFAIGSIFRYFVKSVNLSIMFCNRASFVWLMLLNFIVERSPKVFGVITVLFCGMKKVIVILEFWIATKSLLRTSPCRVPFSSDWISSWRYRWSLIRRLSI